MADMFTVTGMGKQKTFVNELTWKNGTTVHYEAMYK